MQQMPIISTPTLPVLPGSTGVIPLESWCPAFWHLWAALAGEELGHTSNTQTLTKTDEQKKILSKFMILRWAAFTAILGCMRPVRRG